MWVSFRNYKLTPIPDDDYSLRKPAEPELLGTESFLVPKGKDIRHRFTLVGPPGQVWIDLPLTTSQNGGRIGLPPPAPPLATGVNLWADGNPATEYVISSDGLGGGTLMSGNTTSASRDDVAMKYRILDTGSLDWTDLSKGVASWQRYANGPVITQVTMTVVEIETVDPTSDDTVDLHGEPCVRVMINSREADQNRYHTTYQTKDQELAVKVVVKPHNTWGATLWMKSYDPDDTSPYDTDPSLNDNLQGQYPKGHLKADSGHSVVAGTEQLEGGKVYCCALKETNSIGTLKAVLVVSPKCSGDNYEVRVGFTPDLDNCVPEAKKTATLVAWKRYYFEVDRMEKPVAISPLGTAYSPTSGTPTEIQLVDATGFSSGAPQIVVHDFQTGEQEPATIQSVDYQLAKIVITSPLQRAFSATSAGVATAATQGYFEADTSMLETLLTDAFVEVRSADSGASTLPFRGFYAQDPSNILTGYSTAHFSNLNSDFHLWVAGLGHTTFTAPGDEMGYAFTSTNRCFVFTDSIQQLYSSEGDRQTWIRVTSQHEVGHNSATLLVPDCSHTSNVGQDSTACVMQSPAPGNPGLRADSSELLRIRRSDKP